MKRRGVTLRLLARLLRCFSLPHMAANALRTGLTIIGVALGVATIVGIADVSESVLASFGHALRTVAGDAELEVTSPAGAVPERLVSEVGAVPGVGAAAGVLEAFLPLADHPTESLYLLGIDFLGSPVWSTQFPRSAIELEDEIAFLNQPDSVVVTQAYAARAGLRLGDQLRVAGPSGPAVLHVRGILADVPASRLLDGALAIMDLPAAGRLFERADSVDRIAVRLRDDADEDATRDAIAKAVGPAFQAAVPEDRGAQAGKLLFSLRAMLGCMSLAAAMVGALIVYHAVASSLGQRRRELAMLGAVGIARRDIVCLCLVEIVALATAGVGLGIAGGHRLGILASSVVGATASEVWLRLDVNEHVRSGFGTTMAAAVGWTTALVTAWLAVRTTLRTPTVEALRPPGIPGDERRPFGRAMVAGLGLMAASWLIVLAPPGLGLLSTIGMIEGAQAMGFAGAALVAPAFVRGVGLTARAAARRFRWLPGRLAADNLPRAPGRSGATVATITTAMGIAVALACLVESFAGAWASWLEQHFTADLFVGSGGRVRLLAGPPMAHAVAEQVASVPGVESVEPFRVLPIRLGDRPVFVQGFSIAHRLRHGGLPMVEGDLASAAPALEAGDGVLLSDNLAYRLGLHRGDRIAVPTPGGSRDFRIEGTYVDYLGSLDLGAIGMSHQQLAALWNDHSTNLLRVWTEPGTPAKEVRAAILARLGRDGGHYVLTGKEFLGGVRASIDQFFAAAWALELVAALVGVIGVVNAQLAAVLDRRVEISTLRTVGLSTRDLTWSVIAECGTLGALGGVGGVVLGTMLGAEMMYISLPLITGWRIPLALPLAAFASGLALAAGVAALAAWVPARAACRAAVGAWSID